MELFIGRGEYYYQTFLPMRGVFATMTRSMDESVRKPLTFIAVVCIALALSLGWYRVKAYETFLPDFSNGKDLGHVEQKAVAQELIYKVQPGDAWWKIARDHNVSTRALLEANGANVGTELVPGQNIHLPGATSPALSPSSSSPSPSPSPARF